MNKKVLSSLRDPSILFIEIDRGTEILAKLIKIIKIFLTLTRCDRVIYLMRIRRGNEYR